MKNRINFLQPLRLSFSLIALSAAAFSLTACDSDPGTPDGPDAMVPEAGVPEGGQPDAMVPGQTYRLVDLSANRFTLKINPDKSMVLDVVRAMDGSSFRVSGNCQDKLPTFGTLPCKVEASENLTSYPIGTLLKFYEIPGIAVFAGIERPSDVLSGGGAVETFPRMDAWYEVVESCDSIKSTNGLLEFTSLANFGAVVMNLKPTEPIFGVTDYSLEPETSGSSFVSKSYERPLGDIGMETGYLNITASSCKDGVWSLKDEVFEDAKVFSTLSGLTVHTSLGFMVPASLVLSKASDAALTDLTGGFLPRTTPVGDLFKFRFLPSGNAVRVSNYVNISGGPTLQDAAFLPVLDPAAGSRFSAATASSNLLKADFPTAGSTPGLYYSPAVDSAGKETPILAIPFKSRVGGKISIIGFTTGREAAGIGSVIVPNRIFFGTER